MYTREAGPGELYISVEGPSRAEMNIKEIGEGAFCVSYKVTEPGKILNLKIKLMIHSDLFIF